MTAWEKNLIIRAWKKSVRRRTQVKKGEHPVRRGYGAGAVFTRNPKHGGTGKGDAEDIRGDDPSGSCGGALQRGMQGQCGRCRPNPDRYLPGWMRSSMPVSPMYAMSIKSRSSPCGPLRIPRPGAGRRCLGKIVSWTRSGPRKSSCVCWRTRRFGSAAERRENSAPQKDAEFWRNRDHRDLELVSRSTSSLPPHSSRCSWAVKGRSALVMGVTRPFSLTPMTLTL